jgi:hypothetical protein
MQDQSSIDPLTTFILFPQEGKREEKREKTRTVGFPIQSIAIPSSLSSRIHIQNRL